MREQFPPITINFAPVKVIGIPGLSLVAIAVAGRTRVRLGVRRSGIRPTISGGTLPATCTCCVRGMRLWGCDCHRFGVTGTGPAKRG